MADHLYQVTVFNFHTPSPEATRNDAQAGYTITEQDTGKAFHSLTINYSNFPTTLPPSIPANIPHNGVEQLQSLIVAVMNKMKAEGYTPTLVNVSFVIWKSVDLSGVLLFQNLMHQVSARLTAFGIQFATAKGKKFKVLDSTLNLPW